jgi:nucleotide-binding universal stress UspA family protein
MSAIRQSPAPPGAPIFERILCTTGTSARDAEAVQQAAILAGPGATVSFVAVTPEHEPGAPHPIADEIESLVAADLVATRLAVHPDPHIIEANDEVTGMLARSAVHDLLVAAPGDAACAIVARSPIPVLIARPAPAGEAFPESILIAVDDTQEALEAARLGGRLAARHGGVVALVATPEHDEAHRRALDGHVAAVIAATGTRPLVLDEQAPPVAAIVAAAARTDASLIVLGSRPGNPEPSISAQVARDATCSVLVLRQRSNS